MNQYTLILLLSFLSTFSVAQNSTQGFFNLNFAEQSRGPSIEELRRNFNCNIRPLYAPMHPVSKKELNTVKLMKDLMKEYPSSWVSNYISTEISGTCNGIAKKAAGLNGTLTTEQRAILKKADPNTKIFIQVKYQQENAATRKVEASDLNYYIVVVPVVEALYLGGETALQEYLKKNAVDPIPDADLRALERGIIQFTINEKGNVEGAEIKEKTSNKKVDELLLQAILKMPKWQPAQNAKGIPVKQQFEFSAGGMGC